MKRNACIQIICVSALLLTAAWANAAAAFDVIAQNNIFNRARALHEPIDPPPIEYFSLNGTMSYEDSSYAFFDGDSRRFQNRTIKTGEAIGGYVVTGITNDSVILRAANGHEVSLGFGVKLAALTTGISGESK